MKERIEFNSTDELNVWESELIENFKLYYQDYEKQFSKYGVKMLIKPCFCHYKTQRYHSHRKNSGSFLAFRVQLFPSNISLKSAKKDFLFKEFISHKVSSYKKSEDKIYAKLFDLNDVYLILFLKMNLKKLKKGASGNMSPIKESFSDVLIPLVFIFRYRAEIKLSYRGHNLELYFVILIAILIIIGNLVHYGAQHPSFS